MTDTPYTSPEAVERFTSSFWASEMEAGAEMEPDPRGEWVRYSDYAALSAERDALKAELAEAVDALENITIAIGMGWDLDGVVDVARAFLARHQKETGA